MRGKGTRKAKTRARYKRKSFKNPYFKRQQKSTFKLSDLPPKTVLLVIGIIFLVCAIAYALFLSPSHHINNVQVRNSDSRNTTTIEATANAYLDSYHFVFPAKNIHFFKSEGLETELRDLYAFETLNIYVEKDILIIEATERVSELLFEQPKSQYFSDLEGIIVKSTSEDEMKQIAEARTYGRPIIDDSLVQGPFPAYDQYAGLPLIKTDDGTELSPGEQVFNRTIVSFIIDLYQSGVPSAFEGIRNVEFETTYSTWVSVETGSNVDIYFDTQSDIVTQMQYLHSAIEHIDLNTISYVDVRFDNHIYYK